MNSNDFLELFPISKDDGNVTIWQSGPAIGFSLVKDYPKIKGFVPAVKENGEIDSQEMIQIGFDPTKIKNDKVKIFLYISKISKYLIKDKNRFDFDFNDPESPTRQSLELSKKSKNPVDLTDSDRYEFDTIKKYFYDTDLKENTTGDTIINTIIQEHERTVNNLMFRLKLKLLEKSQRNDFFIKFPKLINEFFFGKTYKTTTDFGVGSFIPYPHSYLITHSSIEQIKILGTEIPITNRTAITASILLISLFFLYQDFVIFVNNISSSPIFTISFATIFLVIMEKIIPLILHHLTNLAIIFRYKVGSMRIKIKTPKKRGKYIWTFIVGFSLGCIVLIILEYLNP